MATGYIALVGYVGTRLETVEPGRMKVGKIDMSYLVETYLCASVHVCLCGLCVSVCV